MHSGLVAVAVAKPMRRHGYEGREGHGRLSIWIAARQTISTIAYIGDNKSASMDGSLSSEDTFPRSRLERRWKARIRFLATAFLFTTNLTAQDTKEPMTFEAASVKLAPPGAMPTQSGLMMPSNQAPLPRGLMRMTSRVSVYLFFAEGLDDFTEFLRLDEGYRLGPSGNSTRSRRGSMVNLHASSYSR